MGKAKETIRRRRENLLATKSRRKPCVNKEDQTLDKRDLDPLEINRRFDLGIMKIMTEETLVGIGPTSRIALAISVETTTVEGRMAPPEIAI